MSLDLETGDAQCAELLLGFGLDIAVQPIRPLAEPRVRRDGWFEALARPRGFASPLPVVQWAAASGRALEFDLAVMRIGACWLRGEHPEVGLLAFNLAPETVVSAGAGRQILTLLEREGIEPSRIAVEITETTPILDLARARSLTAELRSHGLWVGIDDLGAGASHMALLAPLSIDFIKIDRIFVGGLPEADVERLFRGIVAFGRELALVTVAEGVESADQRERLLGLGIDYIQGFHDGGEPRLVAAAFPSPRSGSVALPPVRAFGGVTS